VHVEVEKMKTFGKNKKYMTTFCVFAFLSLFLLGFVGTISAHPPSEMTVEYNAVNEQLTVEITHQVSDGVTHYIKLVTISVEDEVERVENYTSQPGNTFTYTYEDVYANEGQTISVYAVCNLGGDLEKSLTVSANGSSTSDDTDTPGFAVITLLVSIGLITLIVRKKH
jgi:desulfoferrodoxin (superoxide reductase-like protein)